MVFVCVCLCECVCAMYDNAVLKGLSHGIITFLETFTFVEFHLSKIRRGDGDRFFQEGDAIDEEFDKVEALEASLHERIGEELLMSEYAIVSVTISLTIDNILQYYGELKVTIAIYLLCIHFFIHPVATF